MILDENNSLISQVFSLSFDIFVKVFVSVVLNRSMIVILHDTYLNGAELAH